MIGIQIGSEIAMFDKVYVRDPNLLKLLLELCMINNQVLLLL
jgi:hypothetical protein